MKHIFLLALLLFAISGSAQIFGPPKDLNVPKNYWKSLDRIERREVKDELRETERFQGNNDQQFDFFIPEVPLPVTESVAAEGNWSRSYLELPENEDEIRTKLKGKFCMAILDTGEPDHSAVVKYKLPGHTSKSFTGEPVIDGHFHATHVAGSQVAKVGDNYIGVAHVAAAAGSLKQVYYKVCTNRGGCSFSWMSSAIRDFTDYYKQELKPDGWDAGINMSIGGPSGNADLSQAMKEAVDAGIVIFASAGNGGRESISYPAKDVSANAVGAHGKDGQKASFSNWGPEMFGNAPGVLVYSTCLGDTECAASGTSMSSPQAAGVYALLKIMNPGWTPQQTLDFMARHATDAGEPGFDDQYGYGIPKMGAYLDAMDDGPDPDPPTCDDGKKNGKEEGVDCGGPDCPPCEPEEPEKPEYRDREMVITMQGPYTIGWWKSDRSRSITGRSSKIYNWSSADVVTLQDGSLTTANGVNLYELETVPLISPAGMSQIVVHELTYRVDSESTHTWEYGALKSNLDQFFGGNRAIGTPDMDAWDAGRYVPFWPDYGACNEKWGAIYQELTPVGAVLEWKGERIYLQEKDLIDYKCRNKK